MLGGVRGKNVVSQQEGMARELSPVANLSNEEGQAKRLRIRTKVVLRACYYVRVFRGLLVATFQRLGVWRARQHWGLRSPFLGA